MLTSQTRFIRMGDFRNVNVESEFAVAALILLKGIQDATTVVAGTALVKILVAIAGAFVVERRSSRRRKCGGKTPFPAQTWLQILSGGWG